MWRRVVGIALISFVWTTRANADWQYTRWGMTLDQVIAASSGQLRRCEQQICNGQTTDHDTAQLYGSYQSGEFKFTAFIFFDKTSSKLSHISLKLDDPGNGVRLIGSLRSKYGEPLSHDRITAMDVFVWRDQIDQITVVQIGNGLPSASVSLSYQPRVTASNKGL